MVLVPWAEKIKQDWEHLVTEENQGHLHTLNIADLGPQQCSYVKYEGLSPLNACGKGMIS